MKKIVTLLSFALLLNASSPSASSITLNEAIDILKTQNLEIKAATLDVSSAKADYETPPKELNYPDARNFFQSKLKYEVPLFAGFAITNYTEIMNSFNKKPKHYFRKHSGFRRDDKKYD